MLYSEKRREMKRDETNMEVEFLALSPDCCELLGASPLSSVKWSLSTDKYFVSVT